jgi:hypothetical protein
MKTQDERNTMNELTTNDLEYEKAMQEMAEYTFAAQITSKASRYYNLILQEFMVIENASKEITVSNDQEAQFAVSLCADINKHKSSLNEATDAILKPIKELMAEIKEGHNYVENELNTYKSHLLALVDAWKAQEKRKAEETSKRMLETYGVDVAIMPTTKIQGSSGMSYEKETWVHEVVDESQVPREFLSVDDKKVKAAIKAGVRTIPGVKIDKQITTIIKRS